MIINNTPFMTDLETILSELQTQLRANDINYLKDIKDGPENVMVTCPYHKGGQERKPSMGVKKTDGTCHCFTCGKVTSLQDMITYCFCKDDVLGAFGWNWLLKNFLSISVEERKDVKIDCSRNIISNQSDIESHRLDDIDNSKHCFVTEEELDEYRWTHPYWAKRGITDDRIIELFDLGFDKKTNCITFPVRDEHGNCLFVARRNVYTKWFNYPQGVEKPLYGLYELHILQQMVDKPLVVTSGILTAKPIKEVFICESMIDCILLWQYGHYTVALNGLGNELQFKQLNQLPCRKFILATDNDEAGQRARERLKTHIRCKMISEIRFPEGIKDIGECSPEQIKNIKNWEEY